MRGCPFGGYFSSNSSTLPWAAKTNKTDVEIVLNQQVKKLNNVVVIGYGTAKKKILLALLPM